MKQKTKAYLLIFFGLFMLLGFAASTRDYPLLVDALTFALFVAAPIAWGVSILSGESKQKQKASEQQRQYLEAARQKEVLRFIQEHKGAATVAMIAAGTTLPAADVDTALRELVIQGLVIMRSDVPANVTYELADYNASQQMRKRSELDLLEE